MGTYFLRRLLWIPFTVIFVSMMAFLMVRFIPGNIVDLIVSENQGNKYNEAAERQAIEHQLGLDVPVYTQYGHWVTDIVVHGSLGYSLNDNKDITNEIFHSLPVTLELGIMAILVSVVISIPIGVYAAIRQDSTSDYILRSAAILLISVPAFWTGTMIMIYPAIWWGWSPPMQLISFVKDPLGNIGMFFLPAVVLGSTMTGTSMRMTRTMMLETLRQDYIRTAWSKGLAERAVVVRHALKNALIPVVTIIGMQLPIIIGGSVIIEKIFVLPGIGRLMLDALIKRDYPVVSGITLVISVFVIAINLVVDLSYGWLDPRIHYQ